MFATVSAWYDLQTMLLFQPAARILQTVGDRTPSRVLSVDSRGDDGGVNQVGRSLLTSYHDMHSDPVPAPTQQQAAAPQPAVQAHKRDASFYLDCSPVIFLVEDCLFKVSRYPFIRHSDVFAGMFQLPQEAGCQGTEGSNDERPIVLPGVTPHEFRALLQVINPLEIPPVLPQTIEEWTSVFKLADLWGMDSVCRLSYDKLSILIDHDKNAVDNILLGRQFKVGQWLFRGYRTLIRRSQPLTDDESEQIGWKTALSLFRIRERYGARLADIRNYHCCAKKDLQVEQLYCRVRCTGCKSACTSESLLHPATLDDEIREVFKDELVNAKWLD